MATTVEDIVTKINQLPDADRAELFRRLSEPLRAKRQSEPTVSNGPKRGIDPNTAWIKANKHEYYGNYVALKDGELIAFGKTIKEADQAAKAKGVRDPFLHYILPKDYIPWGGW